MKPLSEQEWREELELIVSNLMLEVSGIHKKYSSPAIAPRVMNDELDEAYHRAVGRLVNTLKAFADEVEKLIDRQEEVNLQLHGRSDCKSCSLAESIQALLEKRGI